MLVIEPSGLVTQDEAFHAWLRDHGFEPNLTYRIEIDADAVTAYRYLPDVDGRVQYDLEADDVMVRDPATVALRRPLPDFTRRKLEREERRRHRRLSHADG